MGNLSHTQGNVDPYGLPGDGCKEWSSMATRKSAKARAWSRRQLHKGQRRHDRQVVAEALEDMLQPEPPTMREAMLAAWKKECREYLTWNAGQLVGRSMDKDLTPLQKNVLLQAAHHLQMMAA